MNPHIIIDITFFITYTLPYHQYITGTNLIQVSYPVSEKATTYFDIAPVS